MADATTSRKTMRLRSELASVDIVERAAESYALECGLDEEAAGQVAMVVREATVNAVLHGNRRDSSKQVVANMEQTADAVRISVADEGAGFDPGTVPDPLAPENLLRSSGRGIFLMRAYMDEVHFRQLNPGQEIVLVKRRTKITEKE